MTYDPLAQRHGSLIAITWRAIDAARAGVRRDDPPAGHLRRLRLLRNRITEAHQSELLRTEHSTKHIDDWFAEIERVLTMAEAHFRQQTLPLPPHLLPPTKPPASLYPM